MKSTLQLGHQGEEIALKIESLFLKKLKIIMAKGQDSL